MLSRALELEEHFFPPYLNPISETFFQWVLNIAWAFLRSWHLGESYNNSEMIHRNFENRYSGISLVSLAGLKFKKSKQKLNQNLYEMLPVEGSEWQIVKSAREAVFSLKRMIKPEANSGRKWWSNLLVLQQPCGTTCDSLQILAPLSGKLDGLL